MKIETKFNIGDRVRHAGEEIAEVIALRCRQASALHIDYTVRFSHPGREVGPIPEQELVPAPRLPDPDAPWTREHDRVIAERVEGLTVRTDLGFDSVPYTPTPERGAGQYTEIPNYNTDLGAIVRACHAVRQREDVGWQLGPAGADFRGTFYDETGCAIETEASTAAEALARAAYGWSVGETVK